MIPVVKRMLQVMDEKGLITLPLKVNGLEIKVSPVAPLAMAQNMEEVQNVLQYAQIAQGSGPEGAVNIKVDEMMDYVAEKLGVPQKLRPTPQERMMMKQQMQQQAQQQQMMQMAAENPKATAQVVEAATQQQG
jgi:hypothetical protein